MSKTSEVSLALPTPTLGDGPAAVLLVDLESRAVVHANSVALQLAPGVHLPVDLDTWSDAAELRDPDDDELSETHHPLSRILRAEPVMGQAVTAGRGSELGRRREPLWVVGLPMREARELSDHALVVFLPMPREASPRTVSDLADAVDLVLDEPGPDLDDGTSGRSLRERALLATGLSFTLSDARSDDFPLVWVNPAFTRTTGYEFEDAVGRNCRFLQGPDTDPAAPRAIRAALDRGEAITTVLLNYTKEGLAFWNQVTISPIFSGDGELTHFVGIQGDVSGRIEADRQRDAALVAEREARAEAEAAQGRLRFLADATTRLSGSLDVDDASAALLDLVVPDLADWALVVHLDGQGRVEDARHTHRVPEIDLQLAEFVLETSRGGRTPALVARPERGDLVRDLTGPGSGVQDDEAMRLLLDRVPTRSLISVPLPGRRDVDDLLVLGRDHGRDQLTEQDLDVALDLGRRVGLVLDNARLFTTQRHIARTLQRSLLTEPPSIPGLRTAARYRAAASGAEVGGDFYEVILLPGDRVGLAVGDVIGHDVYAAAAMGHLKGALRASAYDETSSPASVLERVDELLTGLGMPTMATVVYADLCPASPDGDPSTALWELAWSCAGHPPIVVRHADGEVEVLGRDWRANDPMLGVRPGARRTTSTPLAAGALLVAYTDGLIERRGENLDDGIARLAAAVAAGPADVDALADHLLERLDPDGGEDDIVVLVVGID